MNEKDQAGHGVEVDPEKIDSYISTSNERLLEAAKAVCWYDWSGNDEDAVQAVEKLREAIKELDI